MDNALQIQNVSKKYPNFSLEDINIELPKGYIMGFIGQNGAGKSTTINILLDLINADSGEVSVLGIDNIKERVALKEHIGVVLEETCFPENLNAKDINLVMKNVFKTWDIKKYYNYIKKFKLDNKKIVKNYSKGMKMKLAIAVALSHDSKLLILDEATSGLDPIVREEILDMLQEFIQDENHSVFMSSHIISDLERVCDYITFINDGKIVFSKEKDVLLEDYGILKCSKEELQELNELDIVSSNVSNFGVEALVKKKSIEKEYVVNNATIEEIMKFYVRGC